MPCQVLEQPPRAKAKIKVSNDAFILTPSSIDLFSDYIKLKVFSKRLTKNWLRKHDQVS